MECGITKLGVKGQIVIPSFFRKSLKLKEGDNFMVFSKDGIVILKKLEPDKKELKKIMDIAIEHAKTHGITEKDLDNAIKEVRK